MSEPIDWGRLSAPFAAEELHWRVGHVAKDGTSASLLVYIDARAVYDRLDEVVGPHRWSIEHRSDGARRLATISIEVAPGQWVAKTDGADDSDMEATKGGISDAAKRAAVLWGIGRYLYQMPSTWVKVQAEKPRDGDAIRIVQDRKPIGWAVPPKLPAWATPKASTPAEKAVAKAAKEIATVTRQATHDASWDADRSRFAVACKDAGTSIDDVSAWCEAHGRPRPSQMDAARRSALVAWLREHGVEVAEWAARAAEEQRAGGEA